MKRLTLALVGVLGLLVAVGPVYAQEFHLKADIPFQFTVNGRTLPAGEYQVLSAGIPSNRGILQIRNAEGQSSILNALPVQLRSTAKNSKLVFNRYGDQYFLSKMWMDGEGDGYEVPQSRLEKELAKHQQLGATEVAAKR